MSGLFGNVPEAKPKKIRKPKTESDGVVPRLFEVYRQEFRRKWNACAAHRFVGCRRCGPEWTALDPLHEVTPLIQYGRDGKHLRDLADAWGEETTASVIREFFATTDPQVVRSDYKVSVLFIHAQRLRLAARVGNHDDRTISNLDAAARAMRRRP